MKNLFGKIENIFTIFSLFWGILFLIINPPFQASDEASHMFRMYGLSEGSMNIQKKNVAGEIQAGLILPVNLVLISMQNHDMIYNTKVKTTFANTKKLFKIPLEPKKKAFCAFAVPYYTIISYFPAFIILWLMKLLNFTPILMMYALRFCTLLTYLTLIYFSIKITPIKKWLFFSASIVPVAIYFASSVSTDAIVTGIAFLALAYTFYLAFENSVQRITLKQITVLASLLTLLSICKFPYITACLLIFIIPSDKFKNIKSRFSCFNYVLLINIFIDVAIIGSTLLMSQDTVSINSNYNLPITKTLELVLTNPMFFANLLYKNFILNGFYYVQGAFGLFGWGNIAVAPWIIYLYLIMLGACGVINDKNEQEFKITLWQKLIFALIFILMTLITAFVGLAVFGKPFGPEIFIFQAKLFQGRYWVPLLPLIFLIFNNNRARYNLKSFKVISILCYTFLLFFCTIILLCRYYY